MYLLKRIRELAQTERIVAVDAMGNTLSYHMLEERSNAFAAFLTRNTMRKRPVMLWGDKENAMLIGIIGALKAGHPYVVLSNIDPAQRIQKVTLECRPCVVVCTGNVSFPCNTQLLLDEQALYALDAPDMDVSVLEKEWLHSEDAACLFYTSGSTGIPKGVVIHLRNIEAMLEWWGHYSNVKDENPRILNFFPYAFSASMETIFYSIGRLGGTLYAADRELVHQYTKLLDMLQNADLHVLDCTPSFLRICLQDDRFCAKNMPSVRMIVPGGEPISADLARTIMRRFPNTRLINRFGSTETTIGPTACILKEDLLMEDFPAPMGNCLPPSEALVLDENGKPVPDGEVGEFVVISEMVADGYYKDPERTKQLFFRTEDGRRGFHTRDLVRRINGLLYYVGRVDNMVKVGGYRVEIEEVERYLSQVFCVAQCAIASVKQDGRVLMLAAYVVLRPGYSSGIDTTIHLKKELANHVQHYMIPQKVVYLEALPRNRNGKLDRMALNRMAELPRRKIKYNT